MELLNIFGIIQNLLAISFLYFLRKPLSVANKVLIAFFLTILFNLGFDLINFTKGGNVKYIAEAASALGFCIPIFMFMYLKYQIQTSKRFQLLDALHIIPVIILYLLLVVTNYSEAHFYNRDYSTKFLLIDLWGLAIIITYSSVTYLKHWRFLKKLKNIYSYETNKIKLLWIVGLLTVFIVLVIVSGYIHTVYKSDTVFRILMNTNLLIISNCMIIMGIWQGEIISDEEDTRYKHSSLKEENTNELIEKLVKHMKSNKPFLENDFNLVEFSNQIGIPRHHITELLNKYLKTNFFQFVRGYRVEHFINLLQSPKNKNVKFLYLAFDSGFNSKTSFNRAFKEVTGKTPSEYMNEIEVN